jgi:CarD family transcriptional regulator
MQFSVGDKVVHPHHGPGEITEVKRREFLDGKKLYYEIQIPTRDLSVYLPLATMKEIGVRPAISRARLPRVLTRLGSQPRRLPPDYRERQEEVWERLRTGRVMQLAGVVRDLTWQEKRDHLTKRDMAYLAQGKSRLAAEMALASGEEISDMERAIEETLAAALSATGEEPRHHRLTRALELSRGLKRES